MNAISSPHSRPQAARVSQRVTEPPDLTSKHQPYEHDHNEKGSDATTAAAARCAKLGSKHKDVISFCLNWICVVLTVAATILFGVWAPLSYRATADGNRDSNEAQSSMMQQIKTANDIASSALRAASTMQTRLGAMGQLAMVDFSMTQNVHRFPLFLGSIWAHLLEISLLMGAGCTGMLILRHRCSLNGSHQLFGDTYATRGGLDDHIDLVRYSGSYANAILNPEQRANGVLSG